MAGIFTIEIMILNMISLSKRVVRYVYIREEIACSGSRKRFALE